MVKAAQSKYRKVEATAVVADECGAVAVHKCRKPLKNSALVFAFADHAKAAQAIVAIEEKAAYDNRLVGVGRWKRLVGAEGGFRSGPQLGIGDGLDVENQVAVGKVAHESQGSCMV